MGDYHDLTNMADTLKTVYDDGLQAQFVEKRSLWGGGEGDAAVLPTSEDDIGGEGFEFSIQYARGQGTGFRNESVALPPPLVGKYDKGLILPKYGYGRLRITGPMIEKARKNVQAFVNSLTHSVQDIYESVVTDLNRAAWGDGFGLIATLSADSDTVTTSGSTTWTVTCDNDQGVERCIEGMLVDFYESTAIDQSTVTSRISSVDYVNKTVEMEPNASAYKSYHPIGSGYTIGTPAVTYASGGYMVAMGSRLATHDTSADTPIEMTGMEGIFDDGTLLAAFEGITVASYPRWAANVLGNSSVNRDVSIDLLLQACDATRARSKMKAGRMYMGLGQRRKYAGLLLPDVRYDAGKLKGGYEVLTFAGGDGTVEIMVCPEAPTNKIFLEPQGEIKKFVLTPLGWGSLDQQMHWRSGYDEWDQFLRVYANLGVKRRQCLTLIKDLTEPTKAY